MGNSKTFRRIIIFINVVLLRLINRRYLKSPDINLFVYAVRLTTNNLIIY